MAFDPMTGEPIEENDNLKFDPMTGEPIGQQPVQNQESGGFDPMTGEPIRRQPVPNPVSGQPAGGFDPMTGQPAGGFDPMTGQPISGNAKKKSKLPLIIGGAAAFVVIAAAAVVVALSVFMGKAGKVMLATANTMKDTPHFVEALEPLRVLQGDKYTIAFAGDVYNVNLNGEMRSSAKEKQISVKLSSNGEKLDVLAGIDSKALKLQVPALSKYVLVYNYAGKNTGYIFDEMSEEEIEAIEAVNTMLSTITDQKKAKNISSDIYKILKDEAKNIELVNAEKKDYKIDGKDVRCKGYTAIITGSNMARVADKVEELIIDEYDSLPKPLLEAAGIRTADIEKRFESLRDELENLDDIELTFYIYKNKLAAIILENPEENAKIELCFQGGDYRMQNMLLKIDNYRIRVTGSDTGTKEKFALKQRINGGDETEIGALEYNYDSGRFSLSAQGMAIDGKLLSSKSEMSLKISNIKAYYYNLSPNLDITIKKDFKMDKFDGKEFDLGNAEEDDYMDLMEDVQDKVYDGDFNNLIKALGISSYLN